MPKHKGFLSFIAIFSYFCYNYVMSITNEQLEHLAILSRLELKDEEKKQFQDQLSNILDFVDQLQNINTDEIEPMHHTTGLETVWREDVIQEFGDREELLDSAPERQGDYIKTKPIF